MSYLCAPEPDQVLAQRRLSDGRSLAVFCRDPEIIMQPVETREVMRYIAGDVTVEIASVRRTFKRFEKPRDGFVLVITDDTKLPEKWRTLCTRATRISILRAFHHFREGDDDRRKLQASDHPRRREDDE